MPPSKDDFNRFQLYLVMAKGPHFTPRHKAKPGKPTDARSGAPHLRAFMLKLFDREDGHAADWPLIAETLLREAFHALDQVPHDPRTHKILGQVQNGAYDRLAAEPSDFEDDGAALNTTHASEYAGPQQSFD